LTPTKEDRERIYIKKAEADMPGWEGEWERVQRMRAQGHPLVKGGRHKEPTMEFTGSKHWSGRGLANSRRRWVK
jgi:hypothetical protein